ncbi:unnamed protein product [[Candida] boidinii]|nr:unnamed protein product [[Candida] boidinii]
MSKRRQEELNESDSDIDVSSTDEEVENGEEQDGENQTVDVDFDFFDLNPAIDFHATKNFLRQLFGDDSVSFSLSDFADMILKDGHIGTTIKTGGKESDPFSILSVINLSENLESPSVKKLISYILEKTSKKAQFNVLLRQLLSPKSKFKTAWVISERLINMPVETAPPMYKMLIEEMEKAENGHENYDFDYYIIISRVYKLVNSEIDKELGEDEGRSKRSKKINIDAPQYDYFHYEDEVLESNAMHYGYFDFTNKNLETDARRVFNDYGIDPQLSVLLLDKKSLANASAEMAEKFPPY